MKKVVALILCLISLFICSSCNNSVDDSNKSIKDNKFYVQRFENYMDMFNCQFDNFYGKIDLTDEYKTEGEKSAKITIQTLQNPFIAPSFTIKAKDLGYDYDVSDFGMIDYVGFSIKNGNPFNSIVNFSAVSQDDIKIIDEYCSLGAYEEKDFRFKINRTLATILHEQVSLFKFTTDVPTGIWFLDGLYVEKALDKIVIEERKFNSDDLLNFNNLSDINYILPYQLYTSSFVTELSINGSKYNRGGQSLRVNFSSLKEIERDQEIQPRKNYAGFTLGPDFINSFNFNKLLDKNLCVDFFNPSEITLNVIIEIADDFGAVYDKVFRVQSGVWQTLLLNAEDINQSSVMLDNISGLSFLIDTEFINGDTEVYFDNMALKGEV